DQTRKAVVKFQASKNLETDGIVGPVTAKALGIVVKISAPELERKQFRELLLKNPNYFGSFPDFEIAPVKPMKFNKKYEELRCVAFYPEADLLEAIIDVKLPYGYKGNLCSQGSFEYVRFFVDWNGDGDFGGPDEDVGIASVNVHNIPDTKEACLDQTKPLSYAVRIKIDPKKSKCSLPNLVKVRAILSWDVPPPAANPNYPPVWGNVIDKWIQIAPQAGGIVLKDIWDFVKVAELKKLDIKPEMLNLGMKILEKKTLAASELKEIYEGKDVPEHRFNFSQVFQIAEKIKQDPILKVKYKLAPEFSKALEAVDLVLAEKSSTKYEELKCVGLNYNRDILVATLTVKQPYGYSGNLCTDGSYQYVGFWAYVWDQIEHMCYWKFLGRSKVNVHDIANIPPEGLQYSAYLPVDFSSYREKCSKPKVLKVRAILSWQNPPPSNNPYYEPVWGNRVDALVQIKPGVTPVKPGEQKPFIWAVGGMAVESISGNPHTITSSIIGDGYANGISLGGGFDAKESPFGGIIRISGTITNAPNNPAEADKLRYKVQYKKMGEAVWHDITKNFRIWIRIDGIPSGYIDQIADGDGYFKYQKDLNYPIIQEVQDDVLAWWRTPVTEGVGGDGLYEVRVLLKQPGAAVPGCPPDHVCSSIVKVRIDNTSPEAKVSLDSGPCEEFTPGSVITGKFKAKDQHFWKYRLTIWPYPPYTNDKFEHHPLPGFDYIYGEIPEYPVMPKSGVTAGTFELDTSGMKPCGYVIYLYVWDRTIVNNHMKGHQTPDKEGFCLLKKV
ncbi:MAG: peptidoglycan-binding protein, partial [Candidatus Hodarchaeota archaeon]